MSDSKSRRQRPHRLRHKMANHEIAESVYTVLANTIENYLRERFRRVDSLVARFGAISGGTDARPDDPSTHETNGHCPEDCSQHDRQT